MDGSDGELFDLSQTVAAIAAELGVEARQVRTTVELLDGGNTIPFIARYRKEATGTLDESALRKIEDALGKARELADRKGTVLRTIGEQGQLTPELRQQILACNDKQTLEELYLPYKPKRRTRATIARERGLQPLAEMLLKQQPLGQKRKDVLQSFVNPAQDVPDAEPRCRERAISSRKSGRKISRLAAGCCNTRPNAARSHRR